MSEISDTASLQTSTISEAPVSREQDSHVRSAASPSTAQQPSPIVDGEGPEDGPLFRATINQLEKRTSTLKAYIKKIIKAATSSLEARRTLLETDSLFIQVLRETPSVEPLLTHYLDEAWQKILQERELLQYSMQSLLIDPLQKLYDMDIKAADAKRKQFEEESKDYYACLAKYLSIKTDSTKEKKRTEYEAKYFAKRSHFDLIRFDYYAFLTDLHGGKKDQEVLYHLLTHQQREYTFYDSIARCLQPLKSGLDELGAIMQEASREQAQVNKERYEKRKMLEGKYTKSEAEASAVMAGQTPVSEPRSSFSFTRDAPREPSINTPGTTLEGSQNPALATPSNVGLGILNNSSPSEAPPSEDKFRGIRDLEQQDRDLLQIAGRRKEGFLFSTSKPSKNHAFDLTANVAWHKYWCVLSAGQLHEYSNWKKQLETHIEPINLRFATVREARNAERRFCFEVITPNIRRIYQATSQEEMYSWIATINNAIESLLNGMSSLVEFGQVDSTLPSGYEENALFQGRSRRISGRPLSGALSGLTAGANAAKEKYLRKKSQPVSSPPAAPSSELSEQWPSNHAAYTKGEVLSSPSESPVVPPRSDEVLTQTLTEIRQDPSNAFCADCNASNPEWCSINLGILLCIECSGIHRSLGTHISKVRSLTLDSASYTADLLELLRSLGNARSNEIWDPHGKEKPTANDMRNIKLKYIQDKYVQRAFVKPCSRNCVDLLFEAVEQDDIPGALYAVALGVDVNVRRRDSAVVTPEEKSPLSKEDARPCGNTLELPRLDVSGNPILGRTIAIPIPEQIPSGRSQEYQSMHYALFFALLHCRYQDGHKIFPMAEFLFQNGADASFMDPISGVTLTESIAMGNAVDDDALAYLNFKNSARGHSAISRSNNVAPVPQPLRHHKSRNYSVG
ncbi:uncharacterized protein BYT42DRAFT_251799 [Radiomyces spectabilis]|uniref:uncharacterized protein n=1 Tax=Radiomyces spectabilis TaxID=64574 RepID=UPI00221F3B02|nr:uncharacterized protein BYT42DRAFT_251799 [Radiomyces spectabilis]KAI8388914.1 hypothetical protein BYT42DRAFT_251799 [Radiomyces spectabilis]